MIVYEIPLNFQFSEVFNTLGGKFFATLLGTKNTTGLWIIYPLEVDGQESDISQYINFSPRTLNGDISALGYKRTFLTNLNIRQVEEYLLLQKQRLEAVN